MFFWQIHANGKLYEVHNFKYWSILETPKTIIMVGRSMENILKFKCLNKLLLKREFFCQNLELDLVLKPASAFFHVIKKQ